MLAEKKSKGIYAEDVGSSSSQKEEDDTTCCPLFMDGLPSNFANNEGLAAIASLLNDEEGEAFIDTKNQNVNKTDSTTTSKIELQSGGGKVQRKSRRKGSSSPYTKDVGKKKKVNEDKKVASVGEAQLFLNLWKI